MAFREQITSLTAYERGSHQAAERLRLGKVDRVAKLAAQCECPSGYDDIFCRQCMWHAIMLDEHKWRKESNAFKSFKEEIHASPEVDAWAQMDVYEQSFDSAVKEVLESKLTPDVLLPMLVRAARLR